LDAVHTFEPSVYSNETKRAMSQKAIIFRIYCSFNVVIIVYKKRKQKLYSSSAALFHTTDKWDERLRKDIIYLFTYFYFFTVYLTTISVAHTIRE
jgi:hypothetical protein